MDAWTAEIERIVSLGIDVKEGLIALSKFFFNSEEYTVYKNPSDSQYVIDLYQTFFSRVPAQVEIDYWVDYLDQGLGRNVLLNWFVCGEEFRLYMAGIFGTDAGRPECNLVNDFYRGFLNRLPDTAGFNSWVGQMTAAMTTGDQAIRVLSHAIASAFLNSAEYALRNRNDLEFLEDMFNGILRRGALPFEFDYWVNEMAGGLTRDDALYYFVNSQEFQLRAQAIIDSM